MPDRKQPEAPSEEDGNDHGGELAKTFKEIEAEPPEDQPPPARQ